MSKISKAFENGKALIGFVTAGDPDLEASEQIILKMAEAGCDLIEIGIPFSDPIAEGPDIQEANLRSLNNGTTTDKVFELTKSITEKIETPIVYMTYLNVLFKYGYDKFLKAAADAGVSGVLIPDMPYEEKNELKSVADKYGVAVLSIAAPAETDRIKMIAENAEGFIYAISTASDNEAYNDLKSVTASIKSASDISVAIDPNIVTPEQARLFARIADGIILSIGIVQIIAKHKTTAPAAVFDYVKSIKEVL